MQPPQRPHPPPQSLYIIGARSTGRTTLVHALEAHFRRLSSPPTVMHEVARTLSRQRGTTSTCDSRRHGSGCVTADDIRAAPARSPVAGDARPHGRAAGRAVRGRGRLADGRRGAADAPEPGGVVPAARAVLPGSQGGAAGLRGLASQCGEH